MAPARPVAFEAPRTGPASLLLSRPMTSTIDQALAAAARALADQPTAARDARPLLAHVLQRTPAYLYAHGDAAVPSEQLEQFQALIERRGAGEPLAYLTGHREFWSLDLAVSPATLVPRGDTEALVQVALRLLPGSAAALLDLGTGSGAIALAVAHERPDVRVVATDASAAALNVAKANARRLNLNVAWRAGDWFDALSPNARFNVIVSNPPYVRADDPHLAGDGVRHEPRSALVAGADGLNDLRTIIARAPDHLEESGALAVEHGHDQAEAVRELFARAGFVATRSESDLAGQPRVTSGRIG